MSSTNYSELSVPVLLMKQERVLQEQEEIARAIQKKLTPPPPVFAPFPIHLIAPPSRKLSPGQCPVCSDIECTCTCFEGEGTPDECTLQVYNLITEEAHLIVRDRLVRICNAAFDGKQSTKSIYVTENTATIVCQDHERACAIQRFLQEKGYTIGFKRVTEVPVKQTKVCKKKKCPCFCVVPEGRDPDEQPCDHVIFIKLTVANPKDPKRVAETLKKDMAPAKSDRVFVNPECTYAFITFQDSDTGHYWAARAQQSLTEKDYEVNFKFYPPPRTKVCKIPECPCFIPEKHSECEEISGKMLYIPLPTKRHQFKQVRTDIQAALGDRTRYAHLWVNDKATPYYALIGFEDHATAARAQDLLSAAFHEVYFDCEDLRKIDDE